jgi:urease accessory protein
LGLGEVQALFLSLALRGALSAAVRLGVLGPLEAQRVQWDYRNHLDEVLAACGTMESGEATQPSPLLDLVGAHHDRLYSRLFQS